MAAIYYYNSAGPAPLGTSGSLSNSDWKFNTGDWFVTNKTPAASSQEKASVTTVLGQKKLLWSHPASGPYPQIPVAGGTNR